jgi:hypothetical protein
MQHQRYGLDSRHDLITLDGTRIPAWTNYVNVGQPESMTINRYAREVDIVITGVRNEHLSEIKVGQVYAASPLEVLIAMDEVEADCECPLDSRQCYNREVQNGHREPMANRKDPRKLPRRPNGKTEEQINAD